MAVDKLVDSAKLDACLDAEADAIRAKTGGSADIPFDFANNKGFADAIAAIPSGGTGYGLLASGSYTYAGEATAQINFPVSYSGTAVYAYAVADSILPGVNQSYAFFVALADLPFLPYFPSDYGFGMCSGADTSGAVSVIGYNTSIRIANNNFNLTRLNNTYKIQPNTYNWFIYGEVST